MATDYGSFNWPGSGASSNASVSTNNAAIPASSTLVGGSDGTLLRPISTDTSGKVNVVLASNQSVNVAQINGVTPLMGNGVTGTGSQRVTVASDNTPFAVKIDQTTPGTTNLVALAANQSVNVAQINAVTPLMGNGVTGTGSQRVTIASDNTAFSVNATLAAGSAVIGHVIADAGSAIIGKVGIDQTTPGTTNLVALAANQSVNVAQINAVTPLMGNGVTGTGSQRVTIASDNTAFSVNATLAAGSAVIGHVIADAGSAIIGKVGIDQTTPGTTNLVALAANQSVNVAQINAVTPLMGNGVTGTGSQRVTIASDNTAFTVNTQEIGQSTSTNALSSGATTALAASLVIKASAGRLYQLTGVNTKASAQYIQVFNNTSVPADTTVPILLAYVPGGGGNFSFDFGTIGRWFATGITVTNSSTAATKTIGSADCWFNAEYL